MDMACVCLCVIKYQCLPIIYQSLLESSSECCLSWFFVSTCCKPDMCSVCLLWHYRIFRNTSSVVNQCTSNCFRLFFKRSILKYVYVLFWSPESLRWTVELWVGVFRCLWSVGGGEGRVGLGRRVNITFMYKFDNLYRVLVIVLRVYNAAFLRYYWFSFFLWWASW